MQEKFTNETFEEFLQQSAEAFEMPPSSKVWKAVAKKTNKRKRRYYFTFAFFISSLIIFIVWKQELLFTPNVQKVTPAIPASSVPGANDKKAAPEKKSNTIFSKKPLTQNVKRTVTTNNSLVQTQNKSIVHEYWQTNLLRKSKSVRRAVAYPVKKTQDNYSFTGHFQKTRSKSNVNLTRLTRKDNKFSTQLFVTPTIGYHKLSEKKSYSPSAAYPNNTALPAGNSANNTVTQIPDIGLELGITSKYYLAKNLKLRGGFQFNINRYNIQAYGSPEETASPFDYISDSMNRITDLSKAGSAVTDRLEDYYLQVAAPVGMEIKFYGNEKMQFGIASTVQPTYMFGNRTYYITSDLKSLAKTPMMVRRWNLNTSFETFASYSTGSVQWQVGPQVRYQIFSSFVNKYPVKENLFDFGLKVGVSFKQQ